MKRGFLYLAARFKRALRYYPFVLVFVLLSAIFAGYLGNAVFAADEEEKEADKIKVKIGIVGNLEETYLDLAVFALQNADSSRYYAEMITIDEDTAKEKLTKGEIIGYVYIPEGYIDDVMSGENRAMSYVVNDSPASALPLIMNEVVEVVSHYVTCSENAIYGYMDFCRDAGVERREYRKNTDKLSIEYVTTILDRESITETKLQSTIKGLDFRGYYICVFFVFLVMLWGIAFAPMMIKNEGALQRLLAFRGVVGTVQVSCDLLSFFLLMALNTLFLFLLAAAFGLLHLVSAIGTWGALLPAVLLICAMQYLLYEISESVISAVLLQLFTAVAGGFASGFFIFRDALPESIALFGSVLPTGIAFDYVTDIAAGRNVVASLLFTLLAFSALFALSIFQRIRKIRGAK